MLLRILLFGRVLDRLQPQRALLTHKHPPDQSYQRADSIKSPSSDRMAARLIDDHGLGARNGLAGGINSSRSCDIFLSKFNLKHDGLNFCPLDGQNLLKLLQNDLLYYHFNL